MKGDSDAHSLIKRKVENALRALAPPPKADAAAAIDHWIRYNGERRAFLTFEQLIDFAHFSPDVRHILREERLDYEYFLGDWKQTFDRLMDLVHRIPNKDLRGAIGNAIAQVIYDTYVSGMYASQTPLQKAQITRLRGTLAEGAKQKTNRANWQKDVRNRARDSVIEQAAMRLHEGPQKTIRATPYAIACAIKDEVNAEFLSEKGRSFGLAEIGVDGIRKRIAVIRKAGRLSWVKIGDAENVP